jgi:2'-5' RNA ligase
MKSPFILLYLPPKNITNRILKIQSEINEVYPIVKTTSLPPHITILPSFKTDERGIQTFTAELEDFLCERKLESIEIETDNFIALPNTNLSIDIAKNEALIEFRKTLKLWLIGLKITPQKREKYFYAPHITIRNNFTRKSHFKAVAAQYAKEQFQEKMHLNELVLFERRAFSWEVKANFQITNS